MGAARVLQLHSEDGESSTHQLELRRLSGGAIGIRIFENEHRAGISQPGTTTLSDITFALVRGTELTITTLGSTYSMRRQQDAVIVRHEALDTGERHSWRLRLVELLLAIRQFSSWAA